MFRNAFLSLAIVAMAVTSLSAANFANDGDLGLQTPNSLIGAPWSHVGGYPIAIATSQSPFTNVYANNNIGANLIGPDNEYLVDTFVEQTVATAPMLYYNFDVRFNQEDSSVDSYQRFALALNAGAETMFDVFVGSKSTWVSDGYDGYDEVTSALSPNTWYNYQFAFDLTNLTYTGRIANDTEAFEISTKTINSAATATVGRNIWNGTVNSLFTDGGTNSLAHPDSYDVDNFSVSDSPFATVGPTAIPEEPEVPRTYSSVVNIDFNGYRDGDDPASALTYAPESGEVWNGIAVNSLGGDDNVSISGSDLLNSAGNVTTIDFDASPVGGDIELSVGTDALLNDYLFTHSSGNTSDAAFTISGLGDIETVDLIFQSPWPGLLAYVVINGAPEQVANPNTVMGTGSNAGNYIYDVPVVNGEVTGTFGDGSGNTVVISGLSVLIPGAETPQIAGDANNDGKVDGSDVTILAGNWQVGVDGLTEATWEMGDFNGDKKVDGSDVTILAGNWQYGVTAAVASVPEPSTIVLLLGGLLSALLIRRKR